MDVNGVSLDSTSSPALGALVDEHGKQTNSSIAQGYMQGAGVGKGLLNNPDQGNQNLAYGNPMSTAIRQRYMGEYTQNMNEINNRVLRAASADHIRNLATTSQLASQEVEMNRQKELLKNQIDQANKRARGQVLGTILGIVGGIGGAVAGGAGGAMAGYQLGQGAGQVAGGS
jgi:hypothetical protein